MSIEQVPVTSPEGAAALSSPASTEPSGQVRRLGVAALPTRWLPLARAAWLLVAVLSFGTFLLQVPTDLSESTVFADFGPIPGELIRRTVHQLGLTAASYGAYVLMFQLLEAVVFFITGAILFWRKSSDWIVLAVATILVAFPAANYPPALQEMMVDHPIQATIGKILTTTAIVGLVSLFYIFPDGRFAPRWTAVIAAGLLLSFLNFMFIPGTVLDTFQWPAALDLAFLVAMLGTAIFAQVYRYRRVSGPLERQQVKWAVLGLSVALTTFIVANMLLDLRVYERFRVGGILAITMFQFVWPLAFLCVPVSLAIAVLQYRLFDLDALISRAILSVTLTTSVVGFYVLVVGGLSLLLRTGEQFVALVATGLVAVLFQPWRERLQRGINHLFYGDRDDPYAVVSRLARQVEQALTPEAILPAIVETVAAALRVPYVALALPAVGGADEAPGAGGQRIAAAAGTPTSTIVEIPLIFRHQPVGTMLLAPRSPGEDFSLADRRLLDDLARQAGIAVHAVRLTDDLQHAREHLVRAREEERRRLRRDLHDGLGSQLAALTIQTGVIRSLIRQDQELAEQELVELRQELRNAIANIRQLVHDLRPPALDELGLVRALRARAIQYGACGLEGAAHRSESETDDPAARGLLITVEAPETLGPLPAAVEVAVYRIVEEALTNVVRHAHAQRCCRIGLWLEHTNTDTDLRLEISDDGIGLPVQYAPGIGLLSMRERAEELGGRCEIGPGGEGGTTMQVSLPLALMPVRNPSLGMEGVGS